MEIITIALQYLKVIPEGYTLLIVMIAIFASLFFKKKDVDLTQVTSISKLQTEQLTQLINQNKELANQLGLVRTELSKAYLVIDELRLRIIELEGILHFQLDSKNESD